MLRGSVVGSSAASFPDQANLSNGSDNDLKCRDFGNAPFPAEPSVPVERARRGQRAAPGAGDAAKNLESSEYYGGNI